jgi:hypothetical protein
MEVEFDISKPQQHAARAQPISNQNAPKSYIGDPGKALPKGNAPVSVGF